MSRNVNINATILTINSNSDESAIIQSATDVPISVNGDILTDSIKATADGLGKINFLSPIDFNGVAVTNWTGGGGGGDYPRAILADSADFKDADATVTSPRVTINKAGMDLYNENFPSTIVFENGTDGVRISRDTTTNYLKIEKNNSAVSGLNIVDGDLQFAGVALSTSNLSDDFTIVNTSANNQSKVGDLTIGDNGANCVLQKGIFKIHNEAANGAIQFSATGGNTRAFIEQNITDNNIDVFGGSGISMDFNLKANDTVQPKLLYDGVSPDVSDWGGFDNVVTKSVTQTITGLKTFSADVKVNQLEITGFGNNIEIQNTVANGNLVFKPTTTILTNLDLHPNLNNVQGELLYNNAKPLLSSWGGYTAFADTLVDKTTDQSISGVKTFTTRQITGEGTGIQYGTNNNNHISAISNVMTLDCGNTMNFNAGTSTKLVVDSNNVTILGDTSGVAYYHGSTLNEEIMNKTTTATAILTTLTSDGILTFLKENIIEGGYNGTTATSYPIEFKNSITINETGANYTAATDSWATSGAANALNINCNTTVSNTKDIIRNGANYLDKVAELYKRYTTTTGQITLSSASGTLISFLNTAIWNVTDIGGTQVGTNTSLTSGAYTILAELPTTSSDFGGFVNLKGIGKFCYSTTAADPNGQPASQVFMTWSYTSGVAASMPTFFVQEVANGSNLYMNGVSGATSSTSAFKLTLTKIMDFTV